MEDIAKEPPARVGKEAPGRVGKELFARVESSVFAARVGKEVSARVESSWSVGVAQEPSTKSRKFLNYHVAKVPSTGSGSVLGSTGTASYRGSMVMTRQSSTTIKCITFEDLKLRRGSKVSSVLSRCGVVLASSAGSAHTFAMSEPVLGLSTFISHNWSTPRVSKFLALALHFNLPWALLWTVIVLTFVGPLTAVGVLPKIEASDAYSYPYTAPHGMTVCFVLPMIVLLYRHDLMRMLHFPFWHEPHVFLDKTCIHQTDLELQRQGILSLSAYLSVSDEMLIVYRSTYLKKLWTVYELASMLMVKPKPRIKVVTTRLTVLLYAWWTGFYAYVLAQVFIGSKAVQEAVGEDLHELLQYSVQYGTMLPLMLPFLYHLRKFGLERRGMHKAASAFCIRSTVCFVEDDRKVVQKNVAHFMRDFGFVTQNATEDEALDAFDIMTRKLVPLHLDASFGAGMVYSQVAGMMLPFAGWCIDIVTANAAEGFPARWYMSEIVYFMGCGFILFPLWFAACLWLTSRFPGVRRVYAVTYMIFVWVSAAALLAVMDMVYTMLYYEATASWGGFAEDLLVSAALALLVAYIYRPRRVPTDAHNSCKVRSVLTTSTADIRHTEL